jgi:hypothetical protein
MVTSKGNPLSEHTIRDYKQRIMSIYNLIDKSYYGHIKELLNYENIIKCIEASELKMKHLYYISIIRLLSHLNKETYNDIIDKHYYPLFIKHKKETEDHINDNVTQVHNAHKYLPYHEVLDHIAQYQILAPNGEIMLKPLMYKLIATFYFLNPNYIPRAEIKTLVIASNKDKTLKDDTNYLILNARHNASHIILNRYKTYRHYGQQIIKLSDPLKLMIRTDLEHVPHNYGDYLFFSKDRTMYGDSTFSTLVSTAFLYVVGKPISIDIARQIQITHFNSTMPSENQRKKFAKTFLHSTDVAKQYIKLDM